jgi:hypothetical protein
LFSVPLPCCSVFHPNVIQFKTPAKLYEKPHWRRTEGKKGASRLTASSLRADDHVADVVLGSCVAVVAVQSSCVSTDLSGASYTVILRVLYVAYPELL